MNGQATQRSNGKYSDLLTHSEIMDGGEKSLVEKLQDHYHNRQAGVTKTKLLARIWFQFQGLTQFYMTMVYLLPFLFADYSDMTLYWAKVFVCYLFIMTEAHWLSSICYRSYLPDKRDKSTLDYNNWFENLPSTFEQKQDHAVDMHDKSDKNGLVWQFCKTCDRYVPPRAHHCNYCQACILRRDHHCYLIGNCIGHYNQRYFIVMCFYVIWASALGFPMTCYYLANSIEAAWWGDYALPYTLFQFVCGKISWQFLLLTFHAYMLMFFGFMSVIYFTGQAIIVITGKTLYEVAKKVDVRVTNSKLDNIRMVFGDYWLLSFLFPAQIIFKQRHDGVNYEGIKIIEKIFKE